jgi:hypothetical protein
MANKNILLIEPGYKNKYPPLGLMKIAQYHGRHGKNDNVRFIKGEDRSVLQRPWDRIYVTTLFSFEWKRIAQAIDFAIEASNGHPNNVFVGGIAASLMHQAFLDQPNWQGVRFSACSKSRTRHLAPKVCKTENASPLVDWKCEKRFRRSGNSQVTKEPRVSPIDPLRRGLWLLVDILQIRPCHQVLRTKLD